MTEENNLPEQEALDLGWQPEEEFKADSKNEGKKWRTAEDFLDRKSLFDKIEGQSKQIKTLQKGQQATATHYQNMEVRAYEQALKTLREEKKEALKEEEHVKAEEIQEKIDDLRDRKPVPQKQTNNAQAEFEAWVDKEGWYKKDPELRALADGFGPQVQAQGIEGPEFLDEIAKRVKAAMPHKFKNPNREKAMVQESGNKAGKADSFQMTEQERAIMKNMLRAKTPSLKDSKKDMTEDEYIEELKKVRG